jgi:hypothetical protein
MAHAPASPPVVAVISASGDDEGPPREIADYLGDIVQIVKGKPMQTTNGSPRFGAASVTRELDASPHKFILTGRSGVGKTFFLSTIPDVFIIPIEEGLKGASPDHDPPRFKAVPRNLNELYEALDAFELLNAPVDGKRPYRHLAIDSLAGVETLVHQHLQTEARVTSMEGKDYQKMWREIEPQFLKIQARLNLLRRCQGVHVWLSAHSAEVIDASSTSGEMYRKWDLLMRAPGQIGAELRNLWRGWADHVLFIDWSMTVGKKSKGARTIGTIKGRVLYTQESGTHFAKTRSRLPPSLPATYVDLAAALKKGVSATDAKLRASLDALLAQLDEASITALGETHAATGNALAALVSRAQGMVSVAREDEPGVEEEAAPIEAGMP